MLGCLFSSCKKLGSNLIHGEIDAWKMVYPNGNMNRSIAIENSDGRWYPNEGKKINKQMRCLVDSSLRVERSRCVKPNPDTTLSLAKDNSK